MGSMVDQMVNIWVRSMIRLIQQLYSNANSCHVNSLMFYHLQKTGLRVLFERVNMKNNTKPKK